MHGTLRFLCLSHLLYGICENVPYESVYFKELHNDQEYYREEKSLLHVAMVAKFLDDAPILTDNIQSEGSCSVNYY